MRRVTGCVAKLKWQPLDEIIAALDCAFYLAFGNVMPTGKRIVLALDVSSSMESGVVGGVVGLTPRVASAAMALITAATEPHSGLSPLHSRCSRLTSAPASVWTR